MTFTFDTGMLIALERRQQSALITFQNILRRGHIPTLPAVALAEWWRGRTRLRHALLASLIVEAPTEAVCKAAGEAVGAVRGAAVTDALVMASAAFRGGGIVYTSDLKDLEKLRAYFPTVAVLRV